MDFRSRISDLGLGALMFGALLLPIQQGGPSPAEQAKIDQQNAALKAMLKTAPKFPMTPRHHRAVAGHAGLGDRHGLLGRLVA